MSQGVLPFQYEIESKESGFTSLAGLGLYLDLLDRLGFQGLVDKHLGVRRDGQGYSDFEMVSALILLNLAGGDCVDDLRVLEGDEGFCRLLERVRHHGLSRRERRAATRRFRKERKRSVPSPSAVFRYLRAFHDPGQEALRSPKRAFIPAPTDCLKGLGRVNGGLAAFAQRQAPSETATLDMDATLIETDKSEALYSYKKEKAYQPMNVWWAEHELVLLTEFRDGNVPAGYEQLRVLKEALELLPADVKKVRLRSDTAGYQHTLLRWCDKEDHKRFGRIDFAVCCDVTPAFKQAVSEVPESSWRPVYKEIDGRREKTDREYAEVCFVPSELGRSKKDPILRYLATREAVRQPCLPGLEDAPLLPFPTLTMARTLYKVHGIVSNLCWDGSELIDWLYKRCGKSEEAHAAMKEDLAGGKLPSGDFGVNAAWWWIVILALNLNSILKRLVLGKEWAPKRMKAIRFHLIRLAGRVVTHARGLIVRLSGGHPSSNLLIEARRRIAGLLPLPAV